MEHIEMNHSMEKAMLQHAFAAQSPINGTLELLPLCNMNCDMCYIRLDRVQVKVGGGLHTADEWISLGQEMAKAGVLFLLLTGGEPLLFPEFKKVYLGLREMGMILTINTNGTLIDEEWAAFFGAHRPRRINITLYGTEEETYRDLCHYPGGFEKTIRAIRLLREHGVDVKVGGSLTKENAKDLDKILDMEERLQVPVRIDTYMMPAERERSAPFDMQARLNPEDAARARVHALKREMGPELFPQYVRQSIEQAEREQTEPAAPRPVTCMAGRCSFTINWQGEMRPCVIMTEPAVSVFEVGFEKAWQYIVEETSKIFLNSRCSVCRLRHLCRTCAAAALLEAGSYGSVPEYLCRYAEESLRLLKMEQEEMEDGED